jgi:6-phosphogluconate dehydrogenase
MSDLAQIGVTGLAVMGRNLARNFARHGHRVAVHNRTYLDHSWRCPAS